MSKYILPLILILLFFTMINLAVHQVSSNQDKTIREDAIRYVGEHCLDTEHYEEWMNNNSEVSFNVSKFKK